MTEVSDTAIPTDPAYLWSTPGIPHAGWRCVDAIDTDAADHECEMCGQEFIRYVHVMLHPEYPKRLNVGCVCAGHMEGDAKAAKARDGRMRSRAEKRRRFAASPQWKRTKKGGYRRKVAGQTFVVFQQKYSGRFGYGAMSVVPGTAASFSPSTYDTDFEARLALFDFIYPFASTVHA
jgi:hypothetical protein